MFLYIGSVKIYDMSLLSPAETIKILLPGLLALTSILVVVIAFLLERYIPLKVQPEGKTYRRLAWFMTTALVEGGIGSVLSLLFLLKIGDIIMEDMSPQASLLYGVILILFISCILSVIIGTIMTVKSITKVT